MILKWFLYFKKEDRFRCNDRKCKKRLQKKFQESVGMGFVRNKGRSVSCLLSSQPWESHQPYFFSNFSLKHVQQMACGSCSVENAMKCAFINYRNRERGTDQHSETELASCMNNQVPGSPELSFLSFKTGFHGRTLGSLSTTRTKALHKVRSQKFTDI